MRPFTAAEAAAKCGVCHGTFCRWLVEGRVSGATRVGRAWEIQRDFRVRLPYPKATLRRAIGE
jgi:hypothetical protein